MKITNMTIRMGAKLTKDFQSAECSAEVTVQLEDGDRPKEIFNMLSASLGTQARTAAKDSLSRILYGEGL